MTWHIILFLSEIIGFQSQLSLTCKRSIVSRTVYTISWNATQENENEREMDIDYFIVQLDSTLPMLVKNTSAQILIRDEQERETDSIVYLTAVDNCGEVRGNASKVLKDDEVSAPMIRDSTSGESSTCEEKLCMMFY